MTSSWGTARSAVRAGAGALLVPLAATGLVACSTENGEGPDLTPASTSATTSPVWSTTTTVTTTTPTTTSVPETTGETSAIWPGTPSPTGPAVLPPVGDGQPAPAPGGHAESSGPWVPYMPALTPFDSCAAARAAGAAPLHRGDPGYSPSLDRDGDGVACEGG